MVIKLMKKFIKNIIVLLIALIIAHVISLIFQCLGVEEQISTIFVLAVFIVSLCTEGYIYGIISAFLSTIVINYTFTYPFNAFDFMTPTNMISALIMLIVAIITGILTTKIKDYEALKAESEREKTRSNLLRAISHDLRTPLTSIYSASSLLKERQGSLTDDQETTMLSNIQKDAEWLIRMVENLLSVTRIDNKSMTINKTSTILDELIDSSVTKFYQSHPDQAIEVSIPKDIVIFSADLILIEQVILNLLDNAIIHAKGMTALSLRAYPEDDHIVFEIMDNGCGIDENKLKNILDGGCEPPQKNPPPKAHQYSGIGLSVCSTIIKAHGGEITAQNLKSGGALFRFTIKREKNVD